MSGSPDLWLWLVFAIIGLLFAFVELVLNVQTGFDLVFLGSAFIIGGLVTYPAHSWEVTAVVTSVICVAYIAFGRSWVHRLSRVKKTRTNIDAIIGKRGIVLKSISRNADGLVKVGNEQWKARAEGDIKEGAEIVVNDVRGATITVGKLKGRQ